jgi:hypothetical protein
MPPLTQVTAVPFTLTVEPPHVELDPPYIHITFRLVSIAIWSKGLRSPGWVGVLAGQELLISLYIGE